MPGYFEYDLRSRWFVAVDCCADSYCWTVAKIADDLPHVYRDLRPACQRGDRMPVYGVQIRIRKIIEMFIDAFV